jgi:hypothetical protein
MAVMLTCFPEKMAAKKFKLVTRYWLQTLTSVTNEDTNPCAVACKRSSVLSFSLSDGYVDSSVLQT